MIRFERFMCFMIHKKGFVEDSKGIIFVENSFVEASKRIVKDSNAFDSHAVRFLSGKKGFVTHTNRLVFDLFHYICVRI